jgi:hypothetical protein
MHIMFVPHWEHWPALSVTGIALSAFHLWSDGEIIYIYIYIYIFFAARLTTLICVSSVLWSPNKRNRTRNVSERYKDVYGSGRTVCQRGRLGVCRTLSIAYVICWGSIKCCHYTCIIFITLFTFSIIGEGWGWLPELLNSSHLNH